MSATDDLAACAKILGYVMGGIEDSPLAGKLYSISIELSDLGDRPDRRQLADLCKDLRELIVDANAVWIKNGIEETHLEFLERSERETQGHSRCGIQHLETLRAAIRGYKLVVNL
ncbi:MAG: hypothetical protein U9N48_07680 [Euryarchaeota archaeon]|nr:hypothetical protein [Euryarchaeota archaeon]